MLRIVACLLAGAACLLGAVVSVGRHRPDYSGMTEQPEESASAIRPLPSSSSDERAPLPTKARGANPDTSFATHVRKAGVAIVGGQVGAPGTIPLSQGATLGSVIERAGGITEFGEKRRVSLLRGEHETLCDLTTAAGRDTPVAVDDVIEVPQVAIFGR